MEKEAKLAPALPGGPSLCFNARSGDFGSVHTGWLMRKAADEVARGEALFLLLPTFTLLAMAAGMTFADVEDRAAGVVGLCLVALLTGGMALVMWALYARVRMDEQGITLGPRWRYGSRRDCRWADITAWYEELYDGPNDEDGPASHRLVIERAGRPPLLFPEHWRWLIGEELKRRLPLKERRPSPQPVPGPFLPAGPEKTTAIRT
jgi:hypothetical protein